MEHLRVPGIVVLHYLSQQAIINTLLIEMKKDA